MMTNLIENEHVLSTPELIGTDEEKINGIKFWSDAIGLFHSINNVFVSFENKTAVITALKAELEIIMVELENLSATVSQNQDGEIPSADQVPASEPSPDVNIVDLTKHNDVANSIVKAPTFENLDKLRRCAGSGIWDKNYRVVLPNDRRKR